MILALAQLFYPLLLSSLLNCSIAWSDPFAVNIIALLMIEKWFLRYSHSNELCSFKLIMSARYKGTRVCFESDLTDREQRRTWKRMINVILIDLASIKYPPMPLSSIYFPMTLSLVKTMCNSRNLKTTFICVVFT